MIKVQSISDIGRNHTFGSSRKRRISCLIEKNIYIKYTHINQIIKLNWIQFNVKYISIINEAWNAISATVYQEKAINH